MHAVLLGNGDGPVSTAVVYNKYFDDINAIDRGRQIGQGDREGLLFIVTWYLDYEFHDHPATCGS